MYLKSSGRKPDEGRDLAELRVFAEVVADQIRQEGVDGLVVRDARARRVGDRDVAFAVDVDEARHAELAVAAEGERVEEAVVDAAVDHVDAAGCPRWCA